MRNDERKQIGLAKGAVGGHSNEKAEIAAEDDVAETGGKNQTEGRHTSGKRGAGDVGLGSTKNAQSRHMDESEGVGRHEKTVKSGGREVGKKMVEAENVMGKSSVGASSTAEGFSDMASAGANRKEAGEPEREEAEKSAMGRERSVPTKNTMGHGERETVAKHTI